MCGLFVCSYLFRLETLPRLMLRLQINASNFLFSVEASLSAGPPLCQLPAYKSTSLAMLGLFGYPDGVVTIRSPSFAI